MASKLRPKNSQSSLVGKVVADEISVVKPTNSNRESAPSYKDQRRSIESYTFPEYDLATGMMTNLPTSGKKTFRHSSVSTGVIPTGEHIVEVFENETALQSECDNVQATYYSGCLAVNRAS